MAYRLANAGSGLNRTTGLVAANSSYTCCFWFKPNSDLTVGQYRSPFAYKNAGYTAWAGIFSGVGNQNYRTQADAGGPTSNTSTFTLNAGQWYHLAYMRSGNTHFFIIGGFTVGSFSLNVSAQTWSEIFLGFDGASSILDCDIAYFREWNTSIGATAIGNEIYSTTAVLTSFLITDTPLTSDLNDISGNGNNWSTVGGGGTFVAGPDITFAGSTSNNPIILELNTPQTIDPNIGTPVFFSLWFKYTAAIGSPTAIGVLAEGPIASNYSPRIIAYDSSLVQLVGTAVNVPIVVPVEVGQDYYFNVFQVAQVSILTGNLSISIDAKPNAAAPAGFIAINDDTDGFPLTITNPNDGSVHQYISPIVSGETGTVAPNGDLILDNLFGGELNRYDRSYNDLGPLAYPPGTGFGLRGAIANSGDGSTSTYKWWIGELTTGKVQYVDFNGNYGPSVYDFGSIFALAISRDETVLYYHGGGASLSMPTKRYDLVNNINLPNLNSGETGYFPGNDILVLADESVIVPYSRPSPANNFVKRFDRNGVLLNTYQFGTEEINHLTISFLDDNSFWVWAYLPDPEGMSKFTRVNADDGSILQTFEAPFFSAGICGLAIEEETFDQRFGHSFSCPFFETPFPYPPTTGIVVEKVVVSSDPADDLIEFNITAGGVPSGGEFTLKDGESESFIGLIAGTYSVTEETVAGFITTYVVSNGDPINAIQIGENETVTVTITNTRYTPGGIYKIQPNKRNDTLWTNVDANTTVDVKIPNPSAKTAFFGG